MPTSENIELFRSLIQGTNDLIHSVRPDGSIEFVNAAWLNALGYSQDEVTDLHLRDIIYADSLEHYTDILESAMSGEVKTNVRATLVAKNGDRIYVQGNIFPRLDDGEVVAAQGFYRDITQQVRSKQELKEERQRTEFIIDLMTHDLTNINQEVLSTLELLLHAPQFPDEFKSFVEGGLNEVERAAHIISNMKKISLVERKSPEAAARNLQEAIQTAAEEVREDFPEKDLEIQVDVTPPDITVLADRYLEDIFHALFHNSMKFDSRKNVNVDVTAEPIKHTPYVRIEVADHGPGILDESKDDIFATLEHRREGITGLGLGLTLVKSIVKNYGGNIQAEDRVEGDFSKGVKIVLILRQPQDIAVQGGKQ